MRLVVNKKWILVFVVLSLLSVGIWFLLREAKLLKQAWSEEKSWMLPGVVTSEEGKRQLIAVQKDNAYSIKVPSCSLYKTSPVGEDALLMYCSLYPSRYFTSLYWLISSPTLVSDFTFSVIKGQTVVEYNGKAMPFEELPTLTSIPIQLSAYGEGVLANSSLWSTTSISHYVRTKRGESEVKKGTLNTISLHTDEVVGRVGYRQLLFSKEEITQLKAETDEKVELLLEKFRKDQSDADETPHFTEGLVYGLYLLSEAEPKLVADTLLDLEQKVVPFKSPITRESEISTSETAPATPSILAPHTKFPLCPNREVQARDWNAPSIKIFLAYQRYQPPTQASQRQTPMNTGIYDDSGNLLYYDDMVQVDALCQKIIEEKDTEKLTQLNILYESFVEQYFVYEKGQEIGTPVIEGADRLRGVVLRGLAKDPNISKQKVSLDTVNLSLFDGILWVYLFGK